jgi:hypothetical protein
MELLANPLGVFGPASEETAILFIAAVVSFAFAAWASITAAKVSARAVGLVALGLGLWLFPTMWNTVDAAF